MIDQDVQEVGRASGVDVYIFFDFILRLAHADSGSLMEDDFDALQGLFEGVIVADIAPDKLGIRIGVIGDCSRRMDL